MGLGMDLIINANDEKIFPKAEFFPEKRRKYTELLNQLKIRH
jgi:hypothetical protein